MGSNPTSDNNCFGSLRFICTSADPLDFSSKVGSEQKKTFLQSLFLQNYGLAEKGIGVPLAQWIARWTSNPKVLGSTPRWDGTYWSVSVVVITSALHAEGRQFEPGTDQILAFQGFYFSV